jgi:hypothetical protein
MDFDIRSMKINQNGDTNLRCCPNLAESKKSGRPKSNKRKKSFLEENKKKNQRRKVIVSNYEAVKGHVSNCEWSLEIV